MGVTHPPNGIEFGPWCPLTQPIFPQKRILKALAPTAPGGVCYTTTQLKTQHLPGGWKMTYRLLPRAPTLPEGGGVSIIQNQKDSQKKQSIRTEWMRHGAGRSYSVFLTWFFVSFFRKSEINKNYLYHDQKAAWVTCVMECRLPMRGSRQVNLENAGVGAPLFHWHTDIFHWHVANFHWHIDIFDWHTGTLTFFTSIMSLLTGILKLHQIRSQVNLNWMEPPIVVGKTKAMEEE